MKILALEFSSPQRGVAVRGPAAAGAAEVLGEAFEAGGKTSEPFRMIEEALAQAGLKREEVECIAVGLGPGSYNGIRVGIAIAQGWQLARSIKLCGMDSVRLIAAGAAAEGLAGTVAVVIDAQRQEFYLALYDIAAGLPREITPLKLVNRAELEVACTGAVTPVGPEVTRWLAHGRIIMPRASILAKMAAAEARFVAGEHLEPVYLRETTFVKAPPPRIIPD